VDNVRLTYDLDPPLINEEVDEITSAQTWYAPLVLDRAVTVKDGGSLMILRAPQNCDGPVTIEARIGVGLVVESGGSLTIAGAPEMPIHLKSSDAAAVWQGIKIDGGSLVMQWVNMSDTDSFCVFANKPEAPDYPVDIRHCTFDGSKQVTGGDMLRLWGKDATKLVVDSCRITNVPNGRGLYLYDCQVLFVGDTIEDCAVSNSYLKKVSGVFQNCVFKDRTSTMGLMFNGVGTTVGFQCCTFENIAPTSDLFNSAIYATEGTAPTFGWEGLTSGVSNVINDSCNFLMTMFGKNVKPIIDNVIPTGGPGGKNDWYQRKSGGKFLQWAGPYPVPLKSYSATGQYWNRGPTVNDFTPSVSGYFDFSGDAKDPWGLCGSGQGLFSRQAGNREDRESQGLDDLQSDLELFSEGLTEEYLEHYADAQQLFHSVASVTEDCGLRWQSVTHVLTTQQHLNAEQGELWIPALLDSSRAVDSYAYSTRVLGNRLLASYRLDREEYSEAINILVSLLGSGLTFDDSLIVATELIGVQLMAGLLENGGGLDENSLHGIPASLAVSSVTQGLELEENLLRQLGTSKSQSTPQIIPSSYRLYQNYPNPFNPNTEIKFDLPENTRVKLRIFNTLGQHVTTLVDEVRAAGAYRLFWDSKGSHGMTVASGVYIYQLNAGNFSDAKKMVLIR
jgi:hypothetical protein